jgi:hypothetical protein
MTPPPSSHLHFDPKVDDDSGEWWFRIAIATSQLRIEDLPALRTPYKDTALRAVNARTDLWGDYLLIKYTNGPDGYLWANFAKAKTEDQATTPYKTETGNKHYDWPTVLHAVAFADDPEYPVTETRPGPRTVSVPRKRARAIVTESAFALCRTVTKYYLGNEPFNIPTHPQPVPAAVSWVVNNSETSLVCLHTDMDLPARGQSWNITEIAGEIEVVGNPSRTRNFPATPFTDWQPFVIADDQQELPTGHFRRITTTLYPPTSAELSSL